MTENQSSSTAAALHDTLISPNCLDSNLEPANVVDGLYAIANGLNHIAEAIGQFGEYFETLNGTLERGFRQSRNS